MRQTIELMVHWAPRILGLLFAAFLSVFALDVFNERHSLWQAMFDLAMHLIPAAVVLVAVAIAWRWRLVGGRVFLALGGWYLFTSWGRFHWSAYLVIAGSLFLLGLLFEIDWWYARLGRRSARSSNL